MDKVAFVDIESPNRRNNSICSIGVVECSLSQQMITDSFSTFVNPEEDFDAVCVSVHGITRSMVADAPTFPEIWKSRLRSVLEGSSIVAYNASYDLAVIHKTLRRYGISAEPPSSQADMLIASKALIPGLDDYKLPTVCNSLEIELGTHHDAISDAMACCEVFWKLRAKEGDLKRFFSPYSRPRDRMRSRERPADKVARADSIAYRDLLELVRIVSGDGRVDLFEAQTLLNVIMGDARLASMPVPSRLSELLFEALRDGEVSTSESDYLIWLMEKMIDPVERGARDVKVAGKRFVLTGDFEYGSKEEVSNLLLSKGAASAPVKGAPSGKTDYVVQGKLGSADYGFGLYGGKIKKAQELILKGKRVRIIDESSLFYALNGDG